MTERTSAGIPLIVCVKLTHAGLMPEGLASACICSSALMYHDTDNAPNAADPLPCRGWPLPKQCHLGSQAESFSTAYASYPRCLDSKMESSSGHAHAHPEPDVDDLASPGWPVLGCWVQGKKQDPQAEQKPSAATLKHMDAAVGQAVDLEAFMKLYEAAPAAEKAAMWALKRDIMLQYAVASASALLERQPLYEQVSRAAHSMCEAKCSGWSMLAWQGCSLGPACQRNQG